MRPRAPHLHRWGVPVYIGGVQPFFSIVVPSYLENYSGGATDREAKFHRAVESVLAQSFTSWELIVVADDCEKTWAAKERYLQRGERIKFFRVPKQRQWSPHVRNFGLHKAVGQYACYLDTDDRFGPYHLAALHAGLQEAEMPAWAAFDSLVWDKGTNFWASQLVSDLLQRRRAGTSNIVHRVGFGYWPEIEYRHPGYGYAVEDRSFVQALQAHSAPVVLSGAEYYVCHIPNDYDI